MPLKIAAKVDPADAAYYRDVIRPLLDHPLIEYVGELNEREKDAFLGQAHALLFPIRWPEPFGLVMVEAMATGTPVIAGRFGSVPEVITDGVTGFIGDSLEEMVLAIRRLDELDRAACRAAVDSRFSVQAMADGYERVYRAVLGEERPSPPAEEPAPSPLVATPVAAANGHGDPA
jgi:glycosyltransferase involved in cell wall biosynthesis